MIWKWLSSFLLLLSLHPTSSFVIPVGVIVTNDAPRKTISINTSPPTSTTRLNNSSNNYAVSARNLAVAGRIPWKKLHITKNMGRQILSIMQEETHGVDVALMFVLSFFTERIGKFIYERFLHRFRNNVDYDDSITRQVSETISEASRLAVVCYFVDAIEVMLEVTGIKGKKVDVSTLMAKVIYATWACLRARMYKRSFFEAVVHRTPQNLKGKQGLVDILDMISDFFLFAVLALLWIDILKIKRGQFLSSLFALGGAGTLALTLACQDLAKRSLNGLSLAASDAFYVGDQILLGDGTHGRIVSTGWLNTEIRGSNELITRIPNTQLANIRISNQSRVKFSQVKQYLRFSYDDLDKIPDICTEIKKEIATSCPKVITDGSRPFRVRWVDYCTDHVKVLVDCRLRNSPIGEKYYEAQEGVLEAIARAVQRKKVVFAMPTELSISKKSSSG